MSTGTENFDILLSTSFFHQQGSVKRTLPWFYSFENLSQMPLEGHKKNASQQNNAKHRKIN